MKFYWCVIRIHAIHNLPEPFCHLSFYLMPISHESSHYRFQSNLFPLWTAAVHIKEKKKSKNCTTILSLPNLLRTFNWKGEMATVERQYAYIKKTTTTGKQNWEITVHYFRYLNCFLKKTNLIFLPQVKGKMKFTSFQHLILSNNSSQNLGKIPISSPWPITLHKIRDQLLEGKWQKFHT